MTQSFNAQISHEQGIKLGISLNTVLFLLLLFIIFAIRITNLNYNTLFVDEAIYATVGKNVWSGVLSQNATSWMYGSYLYPFIAATVGYLTGEVSGLRGLSAILSTIAAVFVYLATVRLFDKPAALWAMLIFGLTAISIDLGQYAVYDVPAIPLLTIALYCLIGATTAAKVKESAYLLTAALSFILATLSKYFAGLYLPTLVFIALACYLFQRRPSYPLFTKFIGPIVLSLGLYAYFYYHDLLILFSGTFGVQSGTPRLIFQDIWSELGVVSLLALAGAYFALSKLFSNSRPKWEMVLWALLIPCLALCLFAAPLYHLVVGNLHSAWKHTIYSLIFLSPLAGHGCAAVITQTRLIQGRWAIPYRVVGTIVTALGLIWFVDYSLDRNWGFQNNWPNVSGVIEYLRSQELTKEDLVLAEGAHIYEYYFDFGPAHRAVWQDTWYMEYGGQQGSEAMASAILDRRFDFVVLDDYYTPGMRQKLEPALTKAGYTIGYEETQRLGTGSNILIQVYIQAK